DVWRGVRSSAGRGGPAATGRGKYRPNVTFVTGDSTGPGVIDARWRRSGGARGFNSGSTTNGHPRQGPWGLWGTFMRQLRFVGLAAALAFAAPAGAETRIFVLKGDDGYGVHDCLASGEQ